MKGGDELKSSGRVLIGGEGGITDGPFTESKEAVGGYFLIEAADYDAAVGIARECPALQHNGRVEIRQISDYDSSLHRRQSQLTAGKEQASAPVDQPDIGRLIEHLFRHQYGRLVAALTRTLGFNNLSLAEDIVQDTLLSAMKVWPLRGVPENPAGWLYVSAKNRAVDKLRHQRLTREKEPDPKLWQDLPGDPHDPAVHFESELSDNQARLIFACCHPLLSPRVRLTLTLKTACGLSVAEIARSLLDKPEAIAQRLVRAKQQIKKAVIDFRMPSPADLPDRLSTALEVLYLLFNEGYSSFAGENLVRYELIAEAIRLTEIIADHPVGRHPKTHALLAIMYLQSSRLPARIDHDGELVLLADQDRSLFDRSLISRGIQHLEKSAAGDELTSFHLKAGIAAEHATVETYPQTNWNRILGYYDDLIAVHSSPVIALNRAVAISMVHGSKKVSKP